MASWNTLHAEVQLMIWEQLTRLPTFSIQDEGSYETETLRRGRLVSYACVNREWQAFFEKKIFRHLTINSTHIENLGAMPQRLRSLVARIWFRIRLTDYGCRLCASFPLNGDYSFDNQIFQNDMHSLFSVLSTWEEPTGEGGVGLQLEIGPHSASDSRHKFRDLLVEDAEESLNYASLTKIHDPAHNWAHDERQLLINLRDLHSIFEPKIKH
ncbi:hypothetical protein QQX98_011110 [Neonectria punicea]|uniref:F-box domain-containing protein n=1 Tax=Neonectria punicea TaxID=979145 RepID=A0ABR1GMI7_9HYPO